MDFFGLFSVPNWFLVTVIILYILHIYFSWNYGTLEALGYPCDKPLPFVGNSLSEIFSVVAENDLKNHQRLSRIHGFYESRNPCLRIGDPAVLKEILVKHFNNFIDRNFIDPKTMNPIVAKMLPVQRGDEWRTNRHVMSPTFTSNKLKQMAPIISKIAVKLTETFVENAEGGHSVDVKSVYTAYFIEVVASCAFGVEINAQSSQDRDIFMANAKRISFQRGTLFFLLIRIIPVKLLQQFPSDVFDKESMNFFKNVTTKAIKMRQSANERKNDFLQLMLDALKEADDPSEPQLVPGTDEPSESWNQPGVPTKQDVKAVLTPDGVLAQSMIFLIAGFESTASALTLITYCLATNPDCQQKLLEEVDRVLAKNEGQVNCNTTAQMPYMDMVISETLRMYPFATRLERECNNDTRIGDHFIPKGTRIIVPVYAIHHDEEFYPDPFQFDPERFNAENKESRNPYTYLPFGSGPRNCIGMRFVLMLLKLTLAHILRDFSFARSSKTQVPLTFKKGSDASLVPSKSIEVKIERRRKP